MPYYRRKFRRTSRRRGPNNGQRTYRRASRPEIPAYVTAPVCKKLVHVTPVLTNTMKELVAVNNTTIAGTVDQLNVIPLGDGIDLRHANKTLIRYLYIRGIVEVHNGPLATNELSHSRLVIVWDKETRGTLPVFTSIIDEYSTLAFPSLANRERFQILYDRVFDTSGDHEWFNTVGQAAWMDFHKFINIKLPVNRMTNWSAGNTGGTYAAILKGGLFLYFISPDPLRAGSLRLRYNYKLTFEDME